MDGFVASPACQRKNEMEEPVQSECLHLCDLLFSLAVSQRPIHTSTAIDSDIDNCHI